MKVTNNIRSEAWLTSQSSDYTLPFIVDFESGEAVVISSFDKQIEKGDKILAISDKNVREFVAKQSEQYPGNSTIWKQKKAFYKLSSGDFKSEEKIKINRNGEELIIPIVRNLTNREVVIARPYTLEWLDSNTIYIDGTRLNDFEMSELMGNFTKAKGIIIDLRGDALLSEHFLGFFIDESVPSFDWGLDTYSSPCKKPSLRTINGYVKAKKSSLTRNIVFLTNETSVGKSETILRIVKHYGIGKIIGEPTAGSYDMMQEVKLPAMYNISFDIYPMTFQNDSQIKYKPIIPDITIKDKDNYPNDPKVKKALDILKEKY
jgi:C-terminal processing protease CtpA/Prc